MIKNFILKLWFVRKIIEEAKQEYQFENLGTIKRYEQLKLHEIDELAEKKLKEILGNADYKSVVTYDRRVNAYYVGGMKLEEGQLLNLRSEAEFYLASELYKIMSDTKKDLAYKTMFEKSQTFDDMRQGKAMLYDISTDKNILNLFKSYQPIAKK